MLHPTWMILIKNNDQLTFQEKKRVTITSMEKIKCMPSVRILIAIPLLLFMGTIIVYQDMRAEPGVNTVAPIWVSFLFFLIALFAIASLKVVTITRDRIVIRWLITRKKIDAPFSNIESISLTERTMTVSDRMFGPNKIMTISFHDKQQKAFTISSGLYSNVTTARQFFRTSYPNLVLER